MGLKLTANPQSSTCGLVQAGEELALAQALADEHTASTAGQSNQCTCWPERGISGYYPMRET